MTFSPHLQCSKTCGRGVRKRDVLCKSSPTAEEVPEALCSSIPRPESQEGCVLGRCPKNNRLQWVVSSWSEVGVRVCTAGSCLGMLRSLTSTQMLTPPSCSTHGAGAYYSSILPPASSWDPAEASIALSGPVRGQWRCRSPPRAWNAPRLGHAECCCTGESVMPRDTLGSPSPATRKSLCQERCSRECESEG